MKNIVFTHKVFEKTRRNFWGLVSKITRKKYIIDITAIVLTPGNYGKNCLGNGSHKNLFGKYIECCCDECGYMMCCLNTHNAEKCLTCSDISCPHSKRNNSPLK